MEQAINAALIYISAFLGANAVMFDRANTEFQLPSPYGMERENRSIHRLLAGDRRNMICYIQDHLMIRYCLAFLDEKAVLVGPYRTGPVGWQEIPSVYFGTAQDRESYRQYYRSLPDIEEKVIRQAVSLLYVSVYGSSEFVPEETINIREYDKSGIPVQAESWNDLFEGHVQDDPDDSFALIAQIRAGNIHGAMKVYRHIMRSRGSAFIFVNVIEGLSSLRAITRFALRMAGIPDSSSNVLFVQFKAKGRVVTSVEQATALGETLLERACALVRESRSKTYSSSIRAAVDHIHGDLAQELSTAALAEVAALSPNRFSTRFHDEVGITPSAYIRRERMRSAAQLLVYTNLDIQHICTMIGILDSNYFTRCFKRQYGVSPSQFRKRGVLDEPFEGNAAPAFE